MRKIEDKEAESIHGIRTLHEEIGNENRFRLMKKDGTAYIRTEGGAGGWQQSHYHRHLQETYIVQEGWIGYAKLKEGKRQISTYGPGELFTTEPNFIHNLYLPAGAVIHTVKHGASASDDRVVDASTKRFDEMTQCLTEDQIERESETMIDRQPSEVYTEEYRHFDTLIWQLPVWCTAIFAATAVGTSSISQADVFAGTTGLSKHSIVTGFLSLMTLVILFLSHVLYRFRQHQTPLKRYARTRIWSSAQTRLQFIVTIEGSTLLLLTALMIGLPRWPSLVACAALFIFLTVIREYKLRRRVRVAS